MKLLSKKLLIAFSIISILLGLFYTVPYILIFIMGIILDMESDLLGVVTSAIFITGIVQLMAGILSLITLRKTLMFVPALVLIMAALILSIVQMLPSLGNGVLNTVTGIFPVLLDGLGLVAVFEVRKSNK